MGRNKIAKVWTLGNTTVRNPERLLGALRVFQKYFDGEKSFSSNIDLQGNFFEKILSHTESGEPMFLESQNPRRFMNILIKSPYLWMKEIINKKMVDFGYPLWIISDLFVYTMIKNHIYAILEDYTPYILRWKEIYGLGKY